MPHLGEAAFKFPGEHFQNIRAKLGLSIFDRNQWLSIGKTDGRRFAQYHRIVRIVDHIKFFIGKLTIQDCC